MANQCRVTFFVAACVLSTGFVSSAGVPVHPADVQTASSEVHSRSVDTEADGPNPVSQSQEPAPNMPSGANQQPILNMSSLGYDIILDTSPSKEFTPGKADPWCKKQGKICVNGVLLRCTRQRFLRMLKKPRVCGRPCVVLGQVFKTGQIAFCLLDACNRERRAGEASRKCNCLRCNNSNLELYQMIK